MAEQLSTPYLLLVPLLVLLYFVRSSRRRHGSGGRPPPSPWALPVIGHLHHVGGALPHRAMSDLSRRLRAPLILLRFCELRVVVASTADAAREMMRTHDLAFAGRPMTPTGKVLLGDSPGLISAPYGAAWRQLRRICTLELLTARRVRSFGPVRADEVGHLLRSLAATETDSPAVNLSERIAAYVADSAVRAVIGSRFANRREFLRLLERRMKLLPAKCLPDLFPSSRLAMLVSGMPRQVRRERREMMEFIDAIVDEHQQNRVAAGDEEDLLDVLLRIQREGELDPPLTADDIKAVIVDIFTASSDTSATALQWAMAELMKNPRVMHKAQEEVRRELAGHDRVTEDNLGRLRYLGLIVKETLRLHPPATLILRECRVPCQVLGFDVPAGVMVLVNAWAISRDAASWGADAEEFRPERFEDNGVDFKGTDFEYIPFGAGRRMCPGMAFGLANVELALAGLLYHFDWELPDGMKPGELDMTEAMGLTTRRRSDLILVPTVRVPVQGH
uniref:Uncharacterized protein n=1 Tax=Avena sativa TaxID=4498 RepID=A0ACD6ADU5_AVESA